MNHPYVAKLQKSTKEVIEKSWEEVNKVHQRNSELNHRIEALEKQLCDKEIRTPKNHGVEDKEQAEKIASPFGTLNDLLSPSFLHKKQKEEKLDTKEDEDQLQADQIHKAELEQLAKKVQQQEATIKNLELALALEKSTVQNLKVVHQPKRNVSLDTCTRLSSFDDASPKSSKSKLASSQNTLLTKNKGLQSNETMSIKSLVGCRGSLSSGSALREQLLSDLMGSEVRVLRRKTKSEGSAEFHKRHRNNTGEVTELITRLSSSNLLPSSGALSSLSRTSSKVTGEVNATFNYR